MFLFKKRRSQLEDESPVDERDSPEEKQRPMKFGLATVFSYKELKKATNNFPDSRVLGGGGFGRVYLVNLRGGGIVKVLKKGNPKRQEECYKIVSSLCCFRHRNLISFYGCTIQRSRELLLVYEHLPNGTLADHLHGDLVLERRLTWARRIQIAIDTAEALAYLQSLHPPVVHGGVKTDNILLDSNFNAKLVDLSLCHLLRLKATEVSTATQGTLSCQKTNYEEHNILMAKGDVYCFGVVLMELISGKQNIDAQRECEELEIAHVDPSLIKFVDPKIWVMEVMNRMAKVAWSCLLPNEMQRPHMAKVLSVLKEIKSASKEVKFSDLIDVGILRPTTTKAAMTIRCGSIKITTALPIKVWIPA